MKVVLDKHRNENYVRHKCIQYEELYLRAFSELRRIDDEIAMLTKKRSEALGNYSFRGATEEDHDMITELNARLDTLEEERNKAMMGRQFTLATREMFNDRLNEIMHNR